MGKPITPEMLIDYEAFRKFTGDAVRLQRILAGLTREELAARSGYTRRTIANIETGVYSTTLHAATSIARALNCSLEDLVPLKS